jgi:hypothetical protein
MKFPSKTTALLQTNFPVGLVALMGLPPVYQ